MKAIVVRLSATAFYLRTMGPPSQPFHEESPIELTLVTNPRCHFRLGSPGPDVADY